MPKIDLEAIQERINKNLPLHNEPQPSERLCEPDSPIWELWQRMAEMYGHQWASQQGDEPNDTWARGLADVTPEQFGAGLRALLKRAEKWPPNLVEFRQLCTGYDPQAWERRAHKIVDTSTLIEDKTAKEVRQALGLSSIRALREKEGL